jgi:ParB-like chromosome segregation protein Spo0J
MATFANNPTTFIQQDPALMRRYRLAELLMKQGGDTSPIQHWTQGLARLAQAGSGTYLASKVEREAKEQQSGTMKTIAEALAAGQPMTSPGTVPGFTPPTDAPGFPAGITETNIPQGQPIPGTGGTEAIARILAGNPQTAPLGLQLQFERMGKSQDLADALTKARAGKELDLSYTPKIEAAKRGANEPFDIAKDQRGAQLDIAKAGPIAGAQAGAQAPYKTVPVEAGGSVVAPFAQGGARQVYQDPRPSLSTAQKAADTEFGQEYAKFNAAGGFADSDKNIAQLRSVLTDLKKGDNLTGPMVGGTLRIGGRDALGLSNKKALDTLERVEEVVQRGLRATLGAQFTEREGERLIARAYNPILPEAENTKRVQRLLTAMEGALKAKKDAFEFYELKGTLQGYKGATGVTMRDLEAAIETPSPGEEKAPAAPGGGWSIRPLP